MLRAYRDTEAHSLPTEAAQFAAIRSNTVERTLKRVPDFLKARPEFTAGGIRWLIFNADSNGLSAHRAIIRIGRRVFIDEHAFNQWIDAQQRHTAQAAA
jgi:hypothetical protein